MLSEAYNVRKIVIATGYTDLRKGIEGLSELVLSNYHLNPAEKDVLFLFCGRRSDRIKGLLWEGDGFLLLYKRLEAGSYSIVETAKANHLNPFWYFTYLLTVLPELRRKYGTIDAAPVAELDRLLPWSKELPDNCHSKRR